MLVTLIPFFLAARLPVEDERAWQHGAEHIYTVHMNMMKTPEGAGVPSDLHVTSRLHCVMRRNETLNCNLKQGSGFNLGGANDDDNGVINRKRNVTDAHVDMTFDKYGIEKLIVNRKTHTYDLNILRMVFEQLNSGDDFDDVAHGAYESDVESTIGTCNVNFKISRHRAPDSSRRSKGFKLELVPPQLRRAPDQTISIEKRTNLNNCSCYADNYYRKYGDTVITDRLNVDLESMISHMDISETDFVSSTTRTGTIYSDNIKYNTVETTTIILEDIKPVMEKPPAIVNPVETKLIANHEMENISVEHQ